MKLTILKRLVPVVAVALMGVTLIASISQYMNNKVYDSTNYANVNVVPSLLLLGEMRKNYFLAWISAQQLFFSINGTEKETLISQISVYRRNVEDTFNKYEFNGCFGTPCFTDEEDKSLYFQEKALWAKFSDSLTQALAEISKNQQGQVKAQNIILETMALNGKLLDVLDQHLQYNAVISKRSADKAAIEKERAFYFLQFIGFVTFISIGAIGFFSIRSILRQLGGEPADAADIAAKLALGDLSPQIQLKPGDTTSLMAKIKQLINAMEKVANRADAVGRGNLADAVEVLSERDRLGQAINHMVVSLRTARIIDDRNNWLNTGNNQLAQALTGDFTPQQIANTALSTIGHYLGAGRGVLYRMRTDVGMLDVLGSYMYSEGENQQKTVKFGEGAIGQVAVEKNPIVLTNISRAAGDGTAPILTGTTNSPPHATYTYPILKENILLGVVEFSFLEQLSEIKLDYLNSALKIIASYLYVAEQRGQIHTLLTLSEQAGRDVRKQNDYLQEVNIRMEEQQQQLQQQAEELLQSNAQMEQQQQNLQQQSEELQQSNAQMEEQHQLLEHSNEVLRQSQTEIDEKAKQLELSNHYKSEFLANMSHELRTPLNAIILLSKMMMDNPDGHLRDSEIKRSEVIHRSGQDLLTLINDVLDLSKVDAGRIELNFVEISSNAIITELRDLFDSVAQNNGVEFIIQDQLNTKLNSDPGKISQIVRNLLSNAFKFTKQGSVTLRIQKIPNDQLPIRISVIDTGIGIPQNKHISIFDAFRQVDGSTSREYGGTGLGLTISLRFAELLGGTISLNSIEGKGSEFTLCLPITPPLSPLSAALPVLTTNISATPKTNVNTPQGKVNDDRHNLKQNDKVILLIDDDLDFGTAVIEINHRLGYKTLVANTGAEGLALTKQHHPAGILLDLGLPDKDGTDILHEIKTTHELASIPVYIISARDHDSTLNQQDIVGYLQKPVVSSQIVEAEAALIDAIKLAPAGGILLVTTMQNETNETNEILRILESRLVSEHYAVHITTPGEELQDALNNHEWGVVMIDLANLTMEKALAVAQTIRSDSHNTAMLFFGIDQLSDDEEALLRSYSDSIIVNAPQAGQRLQENIARFLRTVPSVEQTQLTSVAARSNEKKLAHKKILVIDDDPRNLFVLTSALEQQGAKVFNALNGRRAMEMLENIQVNLIITDIMMPVMDGYQTITALRANPKFAAIPIVALTAKAMQHDRENILEIGADDYLSKPVDYDVLCNMAALWCTKSVE
ncbi:response regulator [Solimicrobium silvestre]|nr:response regulator [Solimicrobium silvestre]